MKGPNRRLNGNVFAMVKHDIAAEYPDIRVVMENGVAFARGSFPITDGTDLIDRFLIEIQFSGDYPDSVPVVREIGGRIPWHEDRHTNRSGEACPIIPEEWLLRPERTSILEFLKGPVRNFFIGQVLVEQGKPWPFGERSHGKRGLLEFYGELIGTTEEAVVRHYLDYLSKETVKGHWECPCGSKKRLRNCHLETLKGMRQKIAPWVASRALRRLDLPALST